MADDFMTASEAHDLVLKVKYEQEQSRIDRKAERQMFLRPAMSLEDMFRQTCARVHFMKTNRDDYLPIGSDAWKENPKAAAKLQSRFQRGMEKTDFAEAKLAAAHRLGDVKQIKEAEKEADDILKTCLHAHYGVGMIYTNFLQSRPGRPLPE